MATVCPGTPVVANEPVTVTPGITITPGVQNIYSSNGIGNPIVAWNPPDEFCTLEFTATPGNELIVPSTQWNVQWNNQDLTAGNDAGSNPAIAAGFGVAPSAGTPVTGPASSGPITIGSNTLTVQILSGTIRVSMPNGSLLGYEPGDPVSNAVIRYTWGTPIHNLAQIYFDNGVDQTPTGLTNYRTSTAVTAPPPNAVCGGATTIDSDSATLHVSFTGVVAGDKYQIRYGTTPGGPYGTTLGPFAVSADGPQSQPTGPVLNPSTSYFFITELLDSGNNVIATSTECTFDTFAAGGFNPQCSGATNIERTQADIHGTVDNMPGSQYARMEVASTPGGPYTVYQSPVNAGSNIVGQAILGQPTGLTPGAAYYVRTAVYSDFAATSFVEASGECPFVTPNPQVNCGAGFVDNITQTSATIHGQVVGSNTTGFLYRLQLATVSGGPYITAPGGVGSTGSDPDNFSLSEGSLTPGTTYFYRWQIIDTFTSSVIDTSAECGSFTTLVLRTATCSGASGVTATTATLNGTLSGIQAGDTYEFHYGTTPGGPYPIVVGPTAAASGPVSAPLTGLTPSTPYYFVIVVKDSGSTVRATSSQCNFTTQSAPPPPFVLAVADAPGAITPTSATLNGHITGAPLGYTYEIQYGVCSATTGGGTSGLLPVSGASPMTVSLAASGLTPNTTYCYNIIVRDPANNIVSTSNTQSFTTPITPIVVDPCEAATAITLTSATLHGTANNAPAGYSYRFRYSTTPGGPYTSVAPAGVASGASPESYSASLSGLTPGTTYYYVSEVLNPALEVVATGDECSFATTGATGPGGFVYWCGTIRDSANCFFVDPGDGEPYYDCNQF